MSNLLPLLPQPPFDYRFEFFKPGKNTYSSDEITLIFGVINRKGFQVIHDSPNIRFEPKSRTAIYSPQNKPFHVRFKKPDVEMDFYLGKAEGKFGQVGYLSIPADKIKRDPYEKFSQLYQVALWICLGLKPYFAWGGHVFELAWHKQKLSFDQITSLSGWVNLFGLAFIDELGGIDNILLEPIETNRKEALENLRVLSVVPLQVGRSPLPDDSALREKEYKKYKLRWPKAFK